MVETWMIASLPTSWAWIVLGTHELGHSPDAVDQAGFSWKILT